MNRSPPELAEGAERVEQGLGRAGAVDTDLEGMGLGDGFEAAGDAGDGFEAVDHRADLQARAAAQSQAGRGAEGLDDPAGADGTEVDGRLAVESE